MNGDSGVVDLATFSKAVGNLLPPQLVECLVDKVRAHAWGTRMGVAAADHAARTHWFGVRSSRLLALAWLTHGA